MNTKEKEKYLFKIVRRVCDWLGEDAEDTTDKEIADLVMQELLDIK